MEELREGQSREAYSAPESGVVVSDPRQCKHEFIAEPRQENGMTPWVCKKPRCGRGLLLTDDDSIENYK
jgi:hypothetical protein